MRRDVVQLMRKTRESLVFSQLVPRDEAVARREEGGEKKDVAVQDKINFQPATSASTRRFVVHRG